MLAVLVIPEAPPSGIDNRVEQLSSYILCIDTFLMSAKIARLFNNGGSQAVRLPAEFRFDGDEVFIRRDDSTGDVILSKKADWSTWQEYLKLRDTAIGAVPEEFMADRPLNVPFTEKSLFGEEQ
jgi:antitoxin VapB